MNRIIDQVARNTDLLPKGMAEAILAGNTPPIQEIVFHLVIAGIDAYLLTVNDANTSWPEKRAARMTLAVAFLAAMVAVGGAENQCGVPTAKVQDCEL